jgi:Tfp pilus assembly protein PilF
VQSDEINNRGAEAYRNGDIGTAINYFEQALVVMPNNDDSLKNLKICYSKRGDQQKVNELDKKLNYLS